ncbi:MAG: 1-deoxy-D-xylulose-5-phosphate reductoisomerase, partial [Candidatus Aureabacteria bacterium]|nr:1-deoxy-D-xylulose-5-phosphate reductoisomerase [Candidatus Auribacterota bacterium]
MQKVKKISILGSTGSIGCSCLDIIRNNPRLFKVLSLSAGRNSGLLLKQIREFRPRYAVIADEKEYPALRKKIPAGVKLLAGNAGILEIASLKETDICVSSLVGSAGLKPTYAAAGAGKRLAIANKESLVMAGQFIMDRARRSGTEIIPVDSEHSAIFQCLAGNSKTDLKNIILTASGGPFLGCSKRRMSAMRPEHALKHPRWKMGAKITVDSATLMNKALEIIEAKWLFALAPEKIKVLIHPESIIHSMVEFRDNSVIAQLSVPDMRIPIQYALTYPDRIESPAGALDLTDIKRLTFVNPDRKKFPFLRLVYHVLEKGGIYPAVMSSSNEVAVEGFLKKQLDIT